MAVELQSGPFITVLTRFVTQAWPSLSLAVGCSLTSLLGTTHDTFGKRPARAAARNDLVGWMLPSSCAARTVSNHGSGFQMPGVCGVCLGGRHAIASSAQSGSMPPVT